MNNGIPLPLVRVNQWFQVLSVLLALGTGQHWILAVPLAVGLWSLLTGKNPLLLAARPVLNTVLKKPLSAYPGEEPAQQRFNQGIAVVCLGLSLIGFAAGVPALGHTFAILVAVAAFVAILGFCVGCFIRYQYQQWKHWRRKAA